MIKFYKNIIDGIGNTPLVEMRRLNPSNHVRIFAKLESANPGGSIKDRTALFMIENAEKKGSLTHDKIILEATSGNTGIGLAMIAAVKGYKLCLTMPESASEERKKILRAMGAELLFTPAGQGTDGAIEVAYKMLRERPDKYFGTDQFNNQDNIAAHYHGTAPEIWEQTEGRVTMVVASLGTSGTAMGISQKLKELNPQIQIVGVEPYLQHKIQGLKNMRESYRPGIFDKRRLDEKINILDDDAFEMSRRIAREEGILVGMSSGAAMFVALQKTRQLKQGVIVVIFPDGGERYLSTELFAYKKEISTFHLYNAFERQKTLFNPIKSDEIHMRTCGPTIHDTPHLGNYRRLVVSDMIGKYFVHKGYKIKHVVDIVDFGDKSIKASEKASMELADYSQKYLNLFIEDTRCLNISQDNIYVKSSDNVETMIKIVEKLTDKDYAYEKLHSVYYNISKLSGYGVLSNIDWRKTRPGKSVDLDDYEKDSPADFALLKRSTLGELKRGIYYKTVWGNVRPGWHLECAAVSHKYFGSNYDIHISGADEIFPHCENILAINKAYANHNGPNVWINVELVMKDGRKMSRSLKNAFSLADLKRKGYSGRDIRFLLLGTHYRKPVNYSDCAMSAARNTLKKIDIFIRRVSALSHHAREDYPETDQWVYDLNNGFTSAFDDDLNIAGAFASLFHFINRVNQPLAAGLISGSDAMKILAALKTINSVLGIMDFDIQTGHDKIDELIGKREQARQAHQWDEADAYRAQLNDMGIDILDTPGGVIWQHK